MGKLASANANGQEA